MKTLLSSNRYVTVPLRGRLGNQFFIYAFAKSLFYKTGKRVKIEIPTNYNGAPDILKFNVSLAQFNPPKAGKNSHKLGKKLVRSHYAMTHSSFLRAFITPHIYQNTKIGNFDPTLFQVPSYAYVKGYFQSADYFKDHFKDWRCEFRLRISLPAAIRALKEKIEKEENAVFIHVRRTDYLSKGNLSWYVQLSMDYYAKAIQQLIILQKKNYPPPPPQFLYFQR